MPKRCPKDAQKMPKRWPKKCLKDCQNMSIGISTKIISNQCPIQQSLFYELHCFNKNCKNHNSPDMFQCYLKKLKWIKITVTTGTHQGKFTQDFKTELNILMRPIWILNIQTEQHVLIILHAKHGTKWTHTNLG